MKSQYVDTMLRALGGVFADARLAYPQDGGLAIDLVTLTRLLKDRGVGLFQFDLPNLDDLLLAGLRDSRLRLSGPLSRAKSPSVHVPKILSGLWLRVFGEDGCLLKDVDVNAILFIRQIALMFKKLELPCSRERMKESLNEYRVVDQGLRSPSLDWESDSLDNAGRVHSVHFCDAVASDTRAEDLPLWGGSESRLSEHDRTLLATLQECADEFSARLGSFNVLSASCRAKSESRSGRGFRHGPGAVAHKTGLVDKYHFPNLSRKLLGTFPRIFMIPKGDPSPTRNHEVPARLCAVPKTAKAPRLIAAEPVEHQWCQQLLLDWFNRQFKEHFGRSINLRDQETSKEMARHGSLYDDNATVDLSSASDRLSCWTVERIFRCNYNLLTSLHAVRTRWVVNHIEFTEPYFLKLKKYASQGTATTFPVQTFVFFTIAVAALRALKHSGSGCSVKHNASLERQVRVFGDDIILPKAGYENLCRLLTLLQLKVNDSKSFAQGHFRESCGGDYYRGYDVTPVKVKRYGSSGPELRASLQDTSNNLFLKGFWMASEEVGYLLGHRVKLMPIVSTDSGTPGRRSFCGSWYQHLPMRWKKGTQTVEYRCWSGKSKTPKHDRDGRSRMRRYLLEPPVRGIMDCDPYTSDLLGRGSSGDGWAWRALEPINGFRANRATY